MEVTMKCPRCKKGVLPELGWKWAGEWYCGEDCMMDAHSDYANGLREHYEHEAWARTEPRNISV